MSEKYKNKFHEMKFTIDHEDDSDADLITSLSKDLEYERINDDFSNELELKLEHISANKNSTNKLVDSKNIIKK